MLTTLITLMGCNNGSVFKLPSPSELEKQGFASPGLPRITAEELKVMYEDRKPMVLLDVRPRSQYLSGYIPGARNIPGNQWEEYFSEIATLPEDRPIITYCDCLDDGESAIAAEKLIELDYDKVSILWKGIYYWQDIGGEVRQ